MKRKIGSLVLSVSSLGSLLDISVDVLTLVEHTIQEFKQKTGEENINGVSSIFLEHHSMRPNEISKGVRRK